MTANRTDNDTDTDNHNHNHNHNVNHTRSGCIRFGCYLINDKESSKTTGWTVPVVSAPNSLPTYLSTYLPTYLPTDRCSCSMMSDNRYNSSVLRRNTKNAGRLHPIRKEDQNELPGSTVSVPVYKHQPTSRTTIPFWYVG